MSRENMTSLRQLGNITGRKPMSQYRSAYRPQPTRSTRLKSLATKTAVAALMIAGSAGIVVAATSSSAHPAASASQPVQPDPCDGWIQVNQGGCVGSLY
jgi:hypothetical protein